MRHFMGTLVVLLIGSLAVLAAYGATWAVATVPIFTGTEVDAGPGRQLPLSGRDIAPLGAAMGWVGLAAIAALLATRTWGRRVVGVIVFVAGASAGVMALTFGFTEVALGLDTEPLDVTVSAWWVLAAVAGLAMAASGIVAVVYGASWPRLGARYSRSVAGEQPVTAAATWDALDRGEDPTLGPIPGSMGNAADRVADVGTNSDSDAQSFDDRWEDGR